MDGLLLVIVLSVVICLVLLPALIMHGARKWGEIHFQEWENYQILVGYLRHLKEEIELMADEWPMCARPVLYAPQDRSAQMEFARAQEHIYEASTLLPEIAKYRLTSAEAKKGGFFALFDNIATIREGIQVSESVGILNNIIGVILDTREKINSNRETNLQLQKSIDQNLESLQEGINETEQIIEAFGNANDDVLWALTLAHQSLDAAFRSLEIHTEDGLEYAVAHTLNRIGNDILDYLKLYVRGLQEKRFQLDEFAKLLREAYYYLNVALEIDELNNWRALRKADNYLKVLPHKLKKAQASLQKFEKLRIEFISLESIIRSYDLERATRRANSLQKECAHYWYPYHHRPDYWRNAIADRPLPLKILLDLRSEFLAQVQPITSGEQELRQSELLAILVLFHKFIHVYDSANRDMRLLYNELLIHKQAHITVRRLISEDGEARKAMEMVENIAKDTEPSIKNASLEIHQIYQNYRATVEKVTGANFPELIGKYEVLIKDCNQVKDYHEQMLVNLREQVFDLRQQLENASEEVREFIEGFPKINDPIRELFITARKASKNILQNLELTGEYNHLNHSQLLIREWIELYEYQINSTKSQKITFEQAHYHAGMQLSSLDTKLRTQEILNQFTWRWAKTEIQEAIEIAQAKIQDQGRYWNMHEGQGWRTLYFLEATKFCNEIYQHVGSIQIELEENVARARHAEEELAQKRKGLLRVINSRKKNGVSLSKNEEFAEKLCNSALWAGSRTDAKIALEIAEKTITGKVSREDRRKGETLIINTAGGAYISGDVRLGDNSTFVGRDLSPKKGGKHGKK
jgi:hypothetical protein